MKNNFNEEVRKMKSKRKLKKMLITALVTVMGIGMMLPVQAATQKDKKATVQYASIPATVETSSYGDVWVTVKYPSDNVDVDYNMRILNSKGKVIKYKENTMGMWGFYNLKKKQLYYYQIREMETTYNYWLGETVIKGEWTKKIPFVIAEYPVSQVGRSRKVRIRMPKIQGVKSYKIYMSYKKNKEWKKLTAVKSGKSIIISKFKGKALKKNKNYYYKIVPSKGVNSTVGVIRFN